MARKQDHPINCFDSWKKCKISWSDLLQLFYVLLNQTRPPIDSYLATFYLLFSLHYPSPHILLGIWTPFHHSRFYFRDTLVLRVVLQKNRKLCYYGRVFFHLTSDYLTNLWGIRDFQKPVGHLECAIRINYYQILACHSSK